MAIALLVWTAVVASVWAVTVLLVRTAEDLEDHGETMASYAETVMLGLIWLVGLAVILLFSTLQGSDQGRQ